MRDAGAMPDAPLMGQRTNGRVKANQKHAWATGGPYVGYENSAFLSTLIVLQCACSGLIVVYQYDRTEPQGGAGLHSSP